MKANEELPKVSVILPVYNDGGYLRQSIDSILAQTYTNFELIVIDDGSTDETQGVLDAYTDQRIKRLKNEVNKGLIYSLNRGLDMAEGRYIARMDADDISYPKRFEKQVEYMERHLDITLCGCSYDIGNNYKIQRSIRLPQSSEELYIRLVETSPLAHSTWMLRASDVKGKVYYDKRYYLAEDYKYILELKKMSKKIGCVGDVLHYYEDRENSVSKREAASNTYYDVRKCVLKEIGVDFSTEFLKKIGWGKGRRYFVYNLILLPYYCGRLYKANKESEFFDKKVMKKEMVHELIPKYLQGRKLNDIFKANGENR